MPRQARLDAPGVLQHVMARGIERRKIFCFCFSFTIHNSPFTIKDTIHHLKKPQAKPLKPTF